jgi:hypothetical protein
MKRLSPGKRNLPDDVCCCACLWCRAAKTRIATGLAAAQTRLRTPEISSAPCAPQKPPINAH